MYYKPCRPPKQPLTPTNTNVNGTFNYWVVVTDNNGCTKTSNTITVIQTDNCTGSPGCLPEDYTLSVVGVNQTPGM